MTRIIGFVLLGALVLVGVAVHKGGGQTSETTEMKNTRVMQGDNVFMDVALDKASNFDGSITVNTSDGTTTGRLQLSCGLAAGGTKCQASNRMPLDAKLGRWTVTEITFTPVSGEAKVLTKHGDLSFEVIPHSEVILPDSATVSDIK